MMACAREPVAVVIPALDEERSLPHVLADIPSAWVDAVVVVDNGSTDRTAEVARDAGATVVRERQRGYGAAMQRGLEEVKRLWPETAIVVFLDADYSDHPDELPKLVEPIVRGQADFVLGSRIRGQRDAGALVPQSYFGNHLACWLLRLFWGGRTTDLGPFRAIRLTVLEQLGMVDRNFGWTVEMQIKAARAGVRTLEVPVSYRRRIGQSKISGTFWGSLRAGWKILYTIARYGLFDRCSQPGNCCEPSHGNLTCSASRSSGGPKHFALPAPHLTPPRKTAR